MNRYEAIDHVRDEDNIEAWLRRQNEGAENDPITEALYRHNVLGGGAYLQNPYMQNQPRDRLAPVRLRSPPRGEQGSQFPVELYPARVEQRAVARDAPPSAPSAMDIESSPDTPKPTATPSELYKMFASLYSAMRKFYTHTATIGELRKRLELKHTKREVNAMFTAYRDAISKLEFPDAPAASSFSSLPSQKAKAPSKKASRAPSKKRSPAGQILNHMGRFNQQGQPIKEDGTVVHCLDGTAPRWIATHAYGGIKEPKQKKAKQRKVNNAPINRQMPVPPPQTESKTNNEPPGDFELSDTPDSWPSTQPYESPRPTAIQNDDNKPAAIQDNVESPRPIAIRDDEKKTAEIENNVSVNMARSPGYTAPSSASSASPPTTPDTQSMAPVSRLGHSVLDDMLGTPGDTMRSISNQAAQFLGIQAADAPSLENSPNTPEYKTPPKSLVRMPKNVGLLALLADASPDKKLQLMASYLKDANAIDAALAQYDSNGESSNEGDVSSSNSNEGDASSSNANEDEARMGGNRQDQMFESMDSPRPRVQFQHPLYEGAQPHDDWSAVLLGGVNMDESNAFNSNLQNYIDMQRESLGLPPLSPVPGSPAGGSVSTVPLSDASTGESSSVRSFDTVRFWGSPSRERNQNVALPPLSVPERRQTTPPGSISPRAFTRDFYARFVDDDMKKQWQSARKQNRLEDENAGQFADEPVMPRPFNVRPATPPSGSFLERVKGQDEQRARIQSPAPRPFSPSSQPGPLTLKQESGISNQLVLPPPNTPIRSGGLMSRPSRLWNNADVVGDSPDSGTTVSVEFEEEYLQNIAARRDGSVAGGYEPRIEDAKSEAWTDDRVTRALTFGGQPLSPEGQKKEEDRIRLLVAMEPIKGESMSKLRDGGWLNDDIINRYMLMQEHFNETDVNGPAPYTRPIVLKSYMGQAIFTPHRTPDDLRNFFTRAEKGYLGRGSLLGKTVVMPVNLSMSHWIVAAVDFDRNKIKIYDPMGVEMYTSEKSQALRRLQAAAQAYTELKKQPRAFVFEDSGPIPQQKDWVSCGVFVCWYIRQLSQYGRVYNRPFDPVQYRLTIEDEIESYDLREMPERPP